MEELKNKLRAISEMDGVGLTLYFLLKTNNGSILKKADLVEDVKGELIKSYKRTMSEMCSNEDISLLNLSAPDDRKNVIYKYDLEESPSFFDCFNNINNDDIETFSFSNDKLASLEGYFVCIGDAEINITLYRKQFSINLFKQGKIYLIKNDDTQITNVKEEFLRIDSKIDLFYLDSTVYVNHVSILERHYDFKEIIVNEANSTIDNIEQLDILENIEVLSEGVEDVKFARKLSKIATNSPVFSLPKEHILQFVSNHRTLQNELRKNSDGSKILLDTKKSQNFFLKLMNDDFLHSELTNYNYVTPAKDKL